MWCGCMTIGPLNELSYPNMKSLSNCFTHWEHAIVSLYKYFSHCPIQVALLVCEAYKNHANQGFDDLLQHQDGG